jgi:hypothetical protein
MGFINEHGGHFPLVLKANQRLPSILPRPCKSKLLIEKMPKHQASAGTKRINTREKSIPLRVGYCPPTLPSSLSQGKRGTNARDN